MSMRYYSIDDKGLVIDGDVASELFEFWKSEQGTEALKHFDLTLEDLEEYEIPDVMDLLSNYGCWYSDVEMDFFTVDRENYNAKFEGEESFVLLPLNKYPTLYKAAYKDEEELMAEVVENYGWMFPKDYDLKSILCHISGVEFA